MNRKFAMALALGLVLLGLLFFMLRDSKPELGQGSNEVKEVASGGNERILPLGEGHAKPAAVTEEATPEPVAEVVEVIKDPLLIGQVIGEGVGIAGADVLLFPVSEIERVVERLERLVPTGGTLPDVPSLFNSVKAEFARFKKTATVLKTDEEGKFRLDRGALGGQFVLTYADGWLFAWGDVVSLQTGRTQELTVGLSRGSQLGGRVVNASGAGVPGVEVIAEYSPAGLGGAGKLMRRALKYVNGEFLKGPFSARTSSDGSFLLDSLPGGTYDVVAKDPNGVEVYAMKVETGTNHTVIMLGRGAAITGTLIDTQGVPVAGVPIQVERQEELLDMPAMMAGFSGIANVLNQYLGDGPRRVVSGADGRFQFFPLGAGRYKLTISEKGFLPLSRDTAVDWNETTDLGEVAVYRGKAISGIVRNLDGQPVQGAEVFAFKEGGNFMNMGGQISDFVTGRKKVKSDRDGFFFMGGLSAGKYTLTATLKGHASDSARAVETGADDVEFALAPGIFFTGRVISAESSEPIAGALVSVGGARARTDKDGRFEVDVVAGGPDFGGGMGMFMMAGPMGRRGAQERTSVTLEASRKGYLTEEATLELDALPTDFELALPTAPVIRGIVRTPDGEPAPGALVRLTPGAGNSDDIPPFVDPGLIFFAATVTDLEGRFTMDDYFAPFDVDWQVIADHLEFTRGASRSFRVDELTQGDVELEVTLIEGASVRGLVLVDGAPVAGATVRLAPRDDDPQAAMFMNMLGLPPSGEASYTNSKGQFEFLRVKEGDYGLTAEMVGYIKAPATSLSILPGDNAVMDLALDSGEVIVGRVVDANDAPVAGAKVSLLRESEPEEILEAQRFFGGGYKVTQTNAQGRYKFQGLEGGEYSVVVTRAGFSRAEEGGVSAGLPVGKIVLIPSGECRVLVADGSTGRPVITFTAGIERSDIEEDEDDVSSWMNWGQEVNDADGIFEKAGLAPGTYSVTLRSRGYLPVTAEVEIEPGGTTEVAVDLARSGQIRGKIINKKGAAIVGADVSIVLKREGDATDEESMRDFFTRSMMGQSATTNDRGEYVLDSGPDEDQTVVVTHEDYVQARKEKVTVARGAEVIVNITMEKGLSVSGRVRDSIGLAARRYVWLRGNGDDNKDTRKGVYPEEDGSFTISGLAPGKYRLMVPGADDTEPLEFDLTKDREGLQLTVPVERDEE